MSLDFVDSLGRVRMATWAIMLREFRSLYGARRLGLAWAFLKPASYVIIFTVLFAFLREHNSPLGHHIAPFMAMGIMNYLLFNVSESSVRNGLRANKSLLSYPRVKPFDVYVGRLLMNFVVNAVVFAVMFVMFILLGLINPPAEPDRLIAPLLSSVLLGFGFGMLNASVIGVYKLWESIWGVISRFIFFTSGVFYLADSMPLPVQRILYWQPLIHNAEWVRSAWYQSFESRFMDPSYVWWVTIVVLFFSFICERALRNQVLAKL
jgi:capsular polysaccharide transport system permease protein